MAPGGGMTGASAAGAADAGAGGAMPGTVHVMVPKRAALWKLP